MADQSHALSLQWLRLRKLTWLVRQRELWPALRRGIGPSLEHQDLVAGREFQTVIDVGANRGQFLLWADRTLTPAMVYCFEPLPSSDLRFVAAMCAAEVTIHPVALGESKTSGTLHITAKNDSSSLLKPAQDKQSKNLTVARTMSIDVARADQLLEASELRKPILVKVDVQGTEAAVLRGFGDLLTEVDAAVVEVGLGAAYHGQCAPSEILTVLSRHGLTPAAAAPVPGTELGRASTQIDLLFTRGSSS